MSDKFENKKEINMDAPLSSRVDSYYKEKFYDILKENSYMNTKMLMERMISSYISNDREMKREENISFKNEISSITELTNTMLAIFKSMAIKSQDTINSKVDFYEQQASNLNLNIDTLNIKNKELTEINNKLNVINDSFENEKLTLQQEIEKLRSELTNKEDLFNKLKIENSDYIKEIKSLGKLEKENEKLVKENERIKKENTMLSENIDLVKKESEVNAKVKILEAQEKYNELQIDYLRIKEELVGLKSNKKSIILER